MTALDDLADEIATQLAGNDHRYAEIARRAVTFPHAPQGCASGTVVPPRPAGQPIPGRGRDDTTTE